MSVSLVYKYKCALWFVLFVNSVMQGLRCLEVPGHVMLSCHGGHDLCNVLGVVSATSFISCGTVVCV